MEQNKQPSGQPRKPEQQPRQTYRKQSQPKSPQGRRPQPKKKQQPNLRLALAACVLVAVAGSDRAGRLQQRAESPPDH